MKEKTITREDERKLYEAYEVLDRLINKQSTFTTIFNEEIHKVFNKLRSTFAHIIPMLYSMTKEWQTYELECKFDKVLEKLEEESLKGE